MLYRVFDNGMDAALLLLLLYIIRLNTKRNIEYIADMPWALDMGFERQILCSMIFDLMSESFINSLNQSSE